MIGLPAVGCLLRRIFMRRRPVNKGKSARVFRKQVSRTKAANIAGPMRGGIRL